METINEDSSSFRNEPSGPPRAWKLAFWSRMTVLVTQITLNWVIEDYDSAAHVLVKTENRTSESKVELVDWWIRNTLDGFQKWDASYFLHIAQFGYEYEQMLAFFPCFPLTIKSIKNLLSVLSQNILSSHFCYLLAGFIVTTLSFIINAQLIISLSLKLGFNPRIAVISVVLYCINPASIFMSALYSGGLFFTLQLMGLYFLSNTFVSVCNFIIAAICFGLSGSVRSNGILGIAFLGHQILKECFGIVYERYSNGKLVIIPRTVSELLLYLSVIIKGILIVISAIPFAYFQYHGYNLYCSSSVKEGTLQKYHWCYNAIPFSYSYVQTEYWNLGFMKYFEWKQFPNFVLVLPVVLITFMAAWLYAQEGDNKRTLYTLGLEPVTWKKRKETIQGGYDFFSSPHMVPYIFHILFITLFGIFNIHVQVLTRILFSASPLLYWFGATMIYRHFNNKKRERTIYIKLLLFYFLSYYFIGILLHCNFYPWT